MSIQTARFDARLSNEQKALFEYAAQLGGYRSLSEFVVSSAQKTADALVEKHRSILASQEDQAIFFKAIMNPAAPGKKLRNAAKKYNQALGKK